mmetsp:Transcript_75957/g.183644  ORF Transcript_75957/g.183644 Transcript_75957/m.183644 type:complete len:287 (-) Transcript_75957:38-898(-)
MHFAVRVGVLHQHAAVLLAGEISRERVALHNGQTEPIGACAQHAQRLRVQRIGGKELLALLLGVHGEVHGLGGGGGLIQQAGVGDVQTRQLRHHRLEVQQRFQPTLRDLRLVWRVARVPARVLQDVAQDHLRRLGAVIALPDVALQHLVLVCHRADGGERFRLTHGLAEAQRLLRADVRRQRRVDERVHRFEAAHRQHLRFVGLRRAHVPRQELVEVLGRVNIGHIVQRRANGRGQRARQHSRHCIAAHPRRGHRRDAAAPERDAAQGGSAGAPGGEQHDDICRVE